jgi:hypothetical protein
MHSAWPLKISHRQGVMSGRVPYGPVRYAPRSNPYPYPQQVSKVNSLWFIEQCR